MITYRFRNNMFHGAKGLINLSNYLRVLRMINQFMYMLLDHIYIAVRKDIQREYSIRFNSDEAKTQRSQTERFYDVLKRQL